MNRRTLLHTLSLVSLSCAFPRLSPGRSAKTGSIPRFRTAICAYSFRDALKSQAMTYDDLVRLAVEHDVDGLDLTVYWFPSTSDDFLLPLRRLAYKNAVELYSISIRTDMCQPTAELQSKEVAEVKKWVDVAEKLGAGHIRVFGGDVPKGRTEEEAVTWVSDVLKQACEYAGSKGVILGLENHGGITAKASRIVEIIKKVDSPWLGINLDTGNFARDAYAQIEACVPYAVNVQLKMEIRDSEGNEGPADWDRLLTLLGKGGYRGYVALEYEAQEDARLAVPRLAKRLRELTLKHSVS